MDKRVEWIQPVYTDCKNCGGVDHAEYHCPCGCHSARFVLTLDNCKIDAEYERLTKAEGRTP